MAVDERRPIPHRRQELHVRRLYRGFGLYVTVYLLFSAFLSWQLGQMSVQYPEAGGVIGWALCAVQFAGFVLSCLYFAPITAAFSGVAAICLGLAAWLA
ncbi:MAG: hypothetical protein QOI58_1215 [Thermoanaerobaculia bacterium]|nr:hypothetical protein [Thermoanaerobaculia bacterium]